MTTQTALQSQAGAQPGRQRDESAITASRDATSAAEVSVRFEESRLATATGAEAVRQSQQVEAARRDYDAAAAFEDSVAGGDL